MSSKPNNVFNSQKLIHQIMTYVCILSITMNTYRTFMIPTFKKNVRFIMPNGKLCKIKHVKVIAYFGQYSVNIVSTENDELPIEEFYYSNHYMMKNIPNLFNNLFSTPVAHDIDVDVSQYLLSHTLFTKMCFAYPACIYQVSPVHKIE